MLTGDQIDSLITGKAVIKGEGWHERMKAWHGLRPSKANPCPYYVLKSNCRMFSGRKGCICQEAYDVLDHRAVWLDEEGRRVYTSEVYDFGGGLKIEAFDRLRQWAVDKELVVDVSSRSPWFPTWTTLIKIRKPNRHGN